MIQNLTSLSMIDYKKKWQKVKKKPDIVIFEGWCVGVTATKK